MKKFAMFIVGIAIFLFLAMYLFIIVFSPFSAKIFQVSDEKCSIYASLDYELIGAKNDYFQDCIHPFSITSDSGIYYSWKGNSLSSDSGSISINGGKVPSVQKWSSSDALVWTVIFPDFENKSFTESKVVEIEKNTYLALFVSPRSKLLGLGWINGDGEIINSKTVEMESYTKPPLKSQIFDS